MRSRAVLGSFLVLAALGGGRAGAEPARVLDLAQCITMALSYDPGLRADELESTAADSRLKELKGQYIPSVTVQAGYSRLSEVAPGSLTIPGAPAPVAFPSSPLNSTAVKLSIQQPLFTGLRISSSIRQAEAAHASAGSDVQRSRADLRYAVQNAFWQLARAKSQEQAARESEEQADRKLADVKTLFDQGVATSNDVMLADMKREDARIDTVKAAGARELARVQLAQLIGVPFGEPLDIPDVSVASPPDPAPTFGHGLEELVARALAARPELASARSRITALEAAMDVARAGRFPSLFLTGDYTLANPNPRVFPQQDEFTGTWSVGVAASFDVGRFPQVAAQEEQARDRTAQARESMRRQSDAAAAEIVRAAITLNAALAAYTSLQAEAAQAQENARYVEERFRQGVVLDSARRDAQSLLVRAQLRQEAGLIDCFVARAGLDRATGG